jgi:uncharacterized protein YcfJ
MRTATRTFFAAAAMLTATTATAQITLYASENFHGPTFTATGPVGNLDGTGFNDRASSVVVERGRWEVCEHAGYAGRCITLAPGNYPSLAPMGMSNAVSSIRPVRQDVAYAPEMQPPPPPPPAVSAEYQRRPDEHLFEVPVASVRAVVGPPEQRCWVERQQVVEPAPSQPNVPGAIIGGIIGGVLGHQVGSGRGKDVATGVGAVAGAAVGANVGRAPGGATTYSQDVQRCAAVPGSARPEYWDVTYHFNGVEHHVQTTTAPGPTIWVNINGEPRV